MIAAALFFLFASTVPAPQQATTERTLSQRFRAPEKSVWIIESNGERIGEHASHYLGREDVAGTQAHHFRGWLRLQLGQVGGMEMRAKADLWTDDRGLPLRSTQEIRTGEAYASVELAFAKGKVQAHVVQGVNARDVALDVDPAVLLLANNFVSHVEIALALVEPGTSAKFAMFSATSLQPFRYELTSKGRFQQEQDGALKSGEEYESSLKERLRVIDGHLVELGIKSQKIAFRRSDVAFEPFEIQKFAPPKPTSAFDGEDVRIARGEAFLAGRITKPKGAKGKLPALFFVSGSGAQDRDGLSNGFDLGTREILDRLTNEGFLVLRVDDRGAGASSPPPANMSYDDLVGDARACVELLAKRDDVDPARIVLIGHSEGGETVPILAGENPSIAAIVLMAAPGRSLLAILTDQNRMALEQSGLKGEELEKELKEVVALLERMCGAAEIEPASLPEDQRGLLANRAWLQGHARQDPIATIRKVRCPVLILQGAKDFQVSLEHDARALEAALKEAQHADFELRAFPALDHLFKRTPGETSELADYAKARPVDAEFLDVMVAWLRPRLKLEKR